MPKVKDPTFEYESLLWDKSVSCVAGLDEAGRGPWAGPVVAAAVVFPKQINPGVLDGLLDSKALSEKKREYWMDTVQKHASGIGIGFASVPDIDTYGIVPATKIAMLKALLQLASPPQAILLDAMEFEQRDLGLVPEADRLKHLLQNQQKFIKGEQVSYSIAAASVIAKQTRDHYMCKVASRYPAFDFDHHKGYGTRAHWQALLTHGPCPLHRKTFKPIKKLLDIGL